MKSWLRRAFEKLIGEWTWKPPAWLVALSGAGAAAGRWLSAHRRASVASLLVVGVLAGAGYGGYRWWKAQPHPERFSTTVTAPKAMALKEGATPNPLVIEFSGSSARLEQIGKVVPRGITISPAITGEWRWTTDRILTFTPQTDWAVGQEYSVKFDRALFPPHVLLEEYTATFSSAPFSGVLRSAEFYQDPVNPKIKRIEATVAFSHPVDTSELPKHISLELRSGDVKKPYAFTVTYDKFKAEAFIHSDTVLIPEDDAQMSVVVSAGVHASRGGSSIKDALSETVTVPGMYNYFHIESVQPTLVPNERSEPEQVLVLNASTGATSEEIQGHFQAFLLPKDLPAAADHEAQKNYRWNQIGPAEVDDSFLSERVSVEAIPTDKDFATLHSFRMKAPVGRFLYVRVAKGARSFGGYVLARDYDVILRVPPFPKEVRILHEGSVLSLTGERKLSVLARGVGALRFQVGRVLPSQVNHLVSQTSGTFAEPSFDNWKFNEYNITEQFSDVKTLEDVEVSKAQYTSFDFGPYLTGDKRGLFLFHAQGWDAEHERPVGAAATRFVLVTDLGVLVKDIVDGGHDIFVVSLHDGSPVSGASVEVLGVNGLPVVTATTDGNGHASFPTLQDFRQEKAPVAYVVSRGEDLSFMPYARSDRALNFSRFDIGGVVTQGLGDRLTAFLFSDRGLYRPGDLFHVAAIVKPADWSRAIAGVPLEVAVTDPRGLEVQKQKVSLSAAGFEEISYQTEETSPTGNYSVALYVVKDGKRGQLLNSTSVRVEEFLPDRMKIATHFSTERSDGWVSPAGLKGRVELRNLFGSPAENRRVVAKIELTAAYPTFRQYKDYQFFDPLEAKRSYEEALNDAETDSSGDAELELGLERYEKATYQLSFTATGFEAEGGRGVTSASRIIVSPMAHLLGFKADGELSYMNKGTERSVDLIAIDPTLKKIALNGLEAQLIEHKYVSTLVQQSNGTYEYESQARDLPVRSPKALSISAKGESLSLPTDQPGDFILSIADTDGTELAHIAYSVVGRANLTRSLEKNAELELKLARSDYSAGDEIELQIKAPYTGAGLITIERDRVYAWKWFKATTTSTVEHITLPEGLEGNAYVNVSFVRGIDSPEIFMSPLSYGVMPFSISRAKRTNTVSLDSPDVAKPGEPFHIRYKGTKAGKAVVYAVDEGILQVAAYKTPDPLAFFFKKKALQVSTEQILDQLLPEFSIVKAQSSTGGDEGMDDIGKNLNPFKRKRDKPVAYWSGLVDIDTTEREVTYDVPDSFSGSLRVMAVAVSPEAIGVASRSAIVRGPFVLSPNVPTFGTPGDEMEVSCGVSNAVEGSGKDAEVTLKLQTSDHLEVLDATSRKLKIAEGHEGVAEFRVRVKPKLGSGTFTFTASLGEKHSKQSVELSVRPAVPMMTTLAGGVLHGGKADVPVTRTMYPEYRTLEASASPLPLGLAHGLVTYLSKFPYGCTEQLVSQAIPALVLRHRPEFGYKPEEVEANLSRVIRILRGRQNGEGAFGFWSANSYVSDFQTAYALNFLTEARDKGYTIPADLLTRGLTYLKTVAERDSSDLPNARTRAFAIYVLTRNGVLTTRYLTPFREWLDAGKLAWKKDATGVFLAGAHKLLKQDRAANNLIDQAAMGTAQVADYKDFYDGSLYDAEYLYVLSRQFSDRVESLPPDGIEHLAQALLGGGYNTLSSAFTILALDSYIDALGDKASARTLGVTLAEIGADDSSTSLAVPPGLFPQIDFSDHAAKLRFGSSADVPLFYGVTLAGFDTTLPKEPLVQKLEVQREFQSQDGKVLAETTIGSEVDVHLKIRAVDQPYASRIAIVDLLPAGFEVVLTPAHPADEEPREVAPPQAESEEGEGEEAEGDQQAEASDEGEPSGDESESNSAPAAGARPHTGWVSPIGTEASTLHPEYADIREDRVVVYGGADSSVNEFIYRIRATNAGTFNVPPPFAESMYDPHVRARGAGTKLTVKKP